MVASTKVKKTSRERARQRRVELDAARARRDAAIEDAAAAFYDADDARAAVLAQLEQIDQTRALAVAALADLKEPNQRIAQLLEIPTAEVRRLRELVEQLHPQPRSESSEPESDREASSELEANEELTHAA